MRRVGLILGFFGSIAVGIFAFRCSGERAYRLDPKGLSSAVNEATEVGNTVVSARDLSRYSGRWTFLNGSESQPLSLCGNGDLAGNPSACVVFVHGYNTSLTDSICHGNELWKTVKSSLGNDASSKVRFFTFCWYGDFGAIGFDAANDSAMHTAPTFGSFLRKLAGVSRPGNQHKLIVVTHSLGALVALESLRRIQEEAEMPIVDTLLMIQPAVAVENFGRGTVEQIYFPPPRGQISGLDFYQWPSYENSGKYFDTVTRATRHTIATASSADEVLGLAFETWTKGLYGARITTYPTNRIALGYLLHAGRPGWTFPSNLEVIELSPKEHLAASIHAHGDLFDAKNHSLIQFLIGEVLRH
jgi:pimeloyl-ACP methyl ester carboxylesterase